MLVTNIIIQLHFKNKINTIHSGNEEMIMNR